MISNTCPFDVTGHPAATVPTGMSAGLPCWHDADRTPLGGRHGVACSGRVRRIDGSRELPGNAGVQGSETGGRALSDASLCRLGSDPSTTLPHITADEHEGEHSGMLVGRPTRLERRDRRRISGTVFEKISNSKLGCDRQTRRCKIPNAVPMTHSFHW